jgi:hypothetical protein
VEVKFTHTHTHTLPPPQAAAPAPAQPLHNLLHLPPKAAAPLSSRQSALLRTSHLRPHLHLTKSARLSVFVRWSSKHPCVATRSIVPLRSRASLHLDLRFSPPKRHLGNICGKDRWHRQSNQKKSASTLPNRAWDTGGYHANCCDRNVDGDVNEVARKFGGHTPLLAIPSSLLVTVTNTSTLRKAPAARPPPRPQHPHSRWKICSTCPPRPQPIRPAGNLPCQGRATRCHGCT